MFKLIILSLIESVVEAILILIVIYLYSHEKEVVSFERWLWIKYRAWLSAKLRSSRRFMNWLYEPTVSEQIEADYRTRPVKTWKGK